MAVVTTEIVGVDFVVSAFRQLFHVWSLILYRYYLLLRLTRIILTVRTWRNRITELGHSIFSRLDGEAFLIISSLHDWTVVNGGPRSDFIGTMRRSKSINELPLNLIVFLVLNLSSLRLPVKIGSYVSLVFDSLFEVFEW